METAKAILLFAAGLICLIKGGDWFVDGAVGIAKRFRLPEILIGATVVSIGTTLPEVMVSATSAFEGHSEISYGNAIGSIICNTALIAALTIAIRPGPVHRKSLGLPVTFFFGTALFYSVISYTTKTYYRWTGILLLAVFLIYTVLSVLRARQELRSEKQTPEDVTPEEKPPVVKLVKDIVFLILGGALIALGAKLLVDNGTFLAAKMGVPESVIALTFVALGTSLPELVTAITALAKGHGALSLGNIIGANLFNLVLVSGTAITIRPFGVPQSATVAGMNPSLLVEIPLMLAVMAILTVPALIKGKLYRWQGILLLCLYTGFCVFQFLIPVL